MQVKGLSECGLILVLSSRFSLDPLDVSLQPACCDDGMELRISSDQYTLLSHGQRKIQTVVDGPIELAGQFESGGKKSR